MSATVASLCATQASGTNCSVPTTLPLAPRNFLGATLSWGGFSDPESGIALYTVSVGSTPLGAQYGIKVYGSGVTTSTVGAVVAEVAHFTIESLQDGEVVYVAVMATNGAGLRSVVSEPLFVIDRLLPLPGVVTFNASTAATGAEFADTNTLGQPVPAVAAGVGFRGTLPHAAQVSSSQVSVTWTPFADASGVTSLSVTLTRAANGHVVGGPTAAASNSSTSLTLTGLSLVAGESYIVYVSGVDAAGNVVVSAGLTPLVIDNTPPVLATTPLDGTLFDEDVNCQPRRGVNVSSSFPVVDGTMGSGGALVVNADGSVSWDLRAVSVVGLQWMPWQDPESGVSRVEAALGTSAGASDVVGWTVVGQLMNAVQFVIPAQPEGTLLWSSLRATNAVGLVAPPVSTDGLRMLCTSDEVGCVYDGYFVCLGVGAASPGAHGVVQPPSR